MNLIAYGAQDAYLMGNQSVSFNNVPIDVEKYCKDTNQKENLLLSCNHSFKSKHIKKWIKNNNNICPRCKYINKKVDI